MAVLLACLQAHGQKIGDVNRDGHVTICDAQRILNHLQGVSKLTTNNLVLPLADADTNGVVNFADLQRVIDTILGRFPVQNFNMALLAYDDGDLLTFLEEYAYGTNPYVMDTDGDGLDDEADVHSRGQAFLSQPPLDVIRESTGAGTIILAQPPLDVQRPSLGGGGGVLLAQPPLDVQRPSLGGGGGVLLAQPPLDVQRPTLGGGGGVLLAQPPVQIIRP